MTELFLVLGVVVLSFALRSFQIRLLRKLGALGILVASFMAFYFVSGSLIGGVIGLLLWFLLPWIELLTRIRQMRLPMGKSLEGEAPPGASRFPELSELTDAVEEAGFEHVADKGWEWEEMHQFFRLFYRDESREQAMICLTEQGELSWVSLTLTSRDSRGTIIRTTNFPFSSPMKMAPEVRLRKFPEEDSFVRLLEEHRAWVYDLGYETEDLIAEDPESLPELIEQELGLQIRHNLKLGLIEVAEVSGMVRYSWRGLFFLYCQLVKDLVRMS